MSDLSNVQRQVTSQEGHDHDVCPSCKSELCGGLIRETIKGGPYSEDEIKSMYGDGKCYSRLIGIELPYDDPEHYDGVSYWKCPECGVVWNRFTGEVKKP